MRTPSPLRLLVVAVPVLLAACGRRGAEGTLTAKWTTLESTKKIDTLKVARPHSFSGPVAARWCPVARRLELTAVHADEGFGLAIYPADSLTAGQYPAFDPGLDTARRPSAAGAARWFTEQKLVGFQSDSGGVDLSVEGSRYHARFGFRMRALQGIDTVRFTGEASNVVPGPCPADSVPSTAPRQ
jgi:hypothetical protein